MYYELLVASNSAAKESTVQILNTLAIRTVCIYSLSSKHYML